MTVHPEFNKTILFDYDFGILNLCDPLMFDKGKGSVQNIRNVSDPSLLRCAAMRIKTNLGNVLYLSSLHSDLSKLGHLSVLSFFSQSISSPAAQPICLPDPAQDYEDVSTVITGWGKTDTDPDDSKGRPVILQEGNKTTITNSQCQEYKWEERPFVITDNMICAVNPKESSCKGDSGGPMITLSKNGTYQQIGIVSFGDSKRDKNGTVLSVCPLETPGVYSRVTAQLDWIHKMIKRQ